MKNEDNSYFDHYAGSYDRELGHALKVSGEDKAFFALGRIRWFSEWLTLQGIQTERFLDFGCGTGSSTRPVMEEIGPNEFLGVDVSRASLEVARREHRQNNVTFEEIGKQEHGRQDAVFCNGVFHHILPEERQASLDYIYQSLKPGGVFCLFENNPWNPATLYVMSRCAFDAEAQTLSPIQTRERMKQAGFEILTTRYLFIFPSWLKRLRFLEKPLSPLPFGTQYAVVGRKPVK